MLMFFWPCSSSLGSSSGVAFGSLESGLPGSSGAGGASGLVSSPEGGFVFVFASSFGVGGSWG